MIRIPNQEKQPVGAPEKKSPGGTFNYQNHRFCRVPINSIKSFLIRTYKNDGDLVVNGRPGWQDEPPTHS